MMNNLKVLHLYMTVFTVNLYLPGFIYISITVLHFYFNMYMHT